MNVLILSAGTRNKIVQYFKRALGESGKVIATDMSENAPAVYEADQFYRVPRMTEEGYLDRILEICCREEIGGVLSLIDPELSLLAQHEADFAAVGAQVIGSSYALCERALDKMEMYRWLRDNGFAAARSYTDLAEFYGDLENGLVSFPVFVKPVRGSASIAISKVEDRETLELLLRKNEGLMIQEFLRGQEIGADVYIDAVSGEVVSVFTKKKLVMRAGETDKAVSFKDDRLFALIEDFAKRSGWRWQIDIDLFDVDGTYYISEVNPRFGGGYPHAYECGCDHMTMILNNLGGVANASAVGKYEENVYMMKYNEIALRKG